MGKGIPYVCSLKAEIAYGMSLHVLACRDAGTLIDKAAAIGPADKGPIGVAPLQVKVPSCVTHRE